MNKAIKLEAELLITEVMLTAIAQDLKTILMEVHLLKVDEQIE